MTNELLSDQDELSKYYRIKCILPTENEFVKTKYLAIVKVTENVVNNANDYVAMINIKSPQGNACSNLFDKISPTMLGERFGFEYTNRLIFMSLKDLLNSDQWQISEEEYEENNNQSVDINNSIRNGEVSPNIYIGYVNPTVQNLPPVLSIDSLVSPIIDDHQQIGYGLFAGCHIPTNSFIGEYTGLISSSKTHQFHANGFSNDYNDMSSYRLTYPSNDGGYAIDAKSYGNVTRFINHSYDPNCEIKNIFLDGIIHCVFVSYSFIYYFVYSLFTIYLKCNFLF